MQHLRTVGEKKDGVESIWIEAPVPTKKEKTSFLREDNEDDEYGDLPMEARPSKFELTQAQAQKATEGIPMELTGLQPDMDPHLRQTLEALEDEAFVVAEVRGLPRNFDPKGAKPKAKEESVVVENATGEAVEEGDGILDDADDFFAELVKAGEREEEEEAPWDFREEGCDDDGESLSSDGEGNGEDAAKGEGDWQDRFKRFQLDRKARNEDDAGSDYEFDATRSEAQDTVGQLPRLPVIGGKRRRKGTSDASGYSMSSSSMFRNKGLTMLDERFDQVRYSRSLADTAIQQFQRSRKIIFQMKRTIMKTMTTRRPSCSTQANILTQSWMISSTIMRSLAAKCFPLCQAKPQ